MASCTTASPCSAADCPRCNWLAAADVFGATGDHERCIAIIEAALQARASRSRANGAAEMRERCAQEADFFMLQLISATAGPEDREELTTAIRALPIAAVEGGETDG